MSPRIRGLHAVRAWLQARPTAADALLALGLLVVGLPQVFVGEFPRGDGLEDFRDPDVWDGLLVAVVTLALAWRRRYPMPVLIFIIGGELVLSAAQYPPSVPDVAAFLIAVYSVAAHRGLAQSALGGLTAFVYFVVYLVMLPLAISPVVVITDCALVIGVWVLGRNLRLRRAYFAELEDRAARLERARGTDARAARIEERSRIARELHDVVAHHVSVMTVQAGAARRIIDRDSDSAREAMSTIEEVGRTALSEMRRIVGVLRTDRDAEQAGRELAPQPGLGDLGELLDHVRETGLSVQLWIEGEARSPSPGVDVAAFRLIQEALTNTLKHAGPQARAWVRLYYGDDDLTVEIEDDGRGTATFMADNGDNPGHGLVGMYERVALYGGELKIGPRVGGGFGVRARFPLEA
ncbi:MULTISPECIES: sensor histidine kinase [Actinomadura]|uniref:sensor histidine kinase n=1 Tax=Actinomadura TaxID=1988 RepID=UPI0004149150|nr:sensor histidine kinase [Actinomadura madurae]MCP9947833.1 sensor histidine kinase [Actinomadura madurae]MCP9964601.1 sensor histidine kinase [Actinomadura madurae]MCP9977075.1 sensor histidine kinase [Actinomadura madurae]MCQ0011414.1 sensor histidine kinase [Actinomadura madurae]URM93497.1 sensor histidine kinase [Actinomadura madurae]